MKTSYIFSLLLPSAIALTPLKIPPSIFEVVDCSTVSGLSDEQKNKLSKLNYHKCCTTGQYNILVTGTDDYPDAYIITTCNVIAELLDQNLDGYADNEEILSGISFQTESVPPIMHGAPTGKQENIGDYLGDGINFDYAYSLQTWKGGDDEDLRPIIVEEVFHMLTQFGWGKAYPDKFGSEDYTSSLMCREMARSSCVNWFHPENICQEVGTQEQPPLEGTCNYASCDCVEWFHQVALILGGIEPAWYGGLIPKTAQELRQTLSLGFLGVMDDPLYAMPRRLITYGYTQQPRDAPYTCYNDSPVCPGMHESEYCDGYSDCGGSYCECDAKVIGTF